MIATEKSPKYYFDGPQKNFPTQNAAQRQAEWFDKRTREHWGDDFVCSKLEWTKCSVQVIAQVVISDYLVPEPIRGKNK